MAVVQSGSVGLYGSLGVHVDAKQTKKEKRRKKGQSTIVCLMKSGEMTMFARGAGGDGGEIVFKCLIVKIKKEIRCGINCVRD